MDDNKSVMDFLMKMQESQGKINHNLSLLNDKFEKFEKISAIAYKLHNEIYGTNMDSGLRLQIKMLEQKNEAQDKKIDLLIADQNKRTGYMIAINVIKLIVSFLWNILKKV